MIWIRFPRLGIGGVQGGKLGSDDLQGPDNRDLDLPKELGHDDQEGRHADVEDREGILEPPDGVAVEEVDAPAGPRRHAAGQRNAPGAQGEKHPGGREYLENHEDHYGGDDYENLPEQ